LPYRFSHLSEALRDWMTATPHGFEIPFTLDIPGGLVGEDKVTPSNRRWPAPIRFSSG
jgi:para-nitrobenzyl esterase